MKFQGKESDPSCSFTLGNTTTSLSSQDKYCLSFYYLTTISLSFFHEIGRLNRQRLKARCFMLPASMPSVSHWSELQVKFREQICPRCPFKMSSTDCAIKEVTCAIKVFVLQPFFESSFIIAFLSSFSPYPSHYYHTPFLPFSFSFSFSLSLPSFISESLFYLV